MRKIIIAFLCSICCTNVINAQDSAEDFRNELEEMYSSMRKDIDILEQHFAEQGLHVKLDFRYDRRLNRIIYEYRLSSAELFFTSDLEAAVENSINEMVNESIKADTTGKYFLWFIDGIKKTNTSFMYIVKYGDKQKDILVPTHELVNRAMKYYLKSISISKK